MSSVPAWAVGVALILVEAGRSLPALWRVWKHRSSDGVSPESLGVLAGTGLGWPVMAVLIGAWWVLAANILWLILHLTWCALVAWSSPAKRVRMVRSAALAAVALAVAVVILNTRMGTADSLGLALGASAVLFCAPVLIEAMTSSTTRGLSIWTLAVNTCEGAIYLAAGIGLLAVSERETSVAGYTFFGVVSVIAWLPVLVRVLWRRAHQLE